MATRFMTTHKSNNAAINDLADRAELNTAAVTNNTTTTTYNVTAAQFLSGLITTSAAGALAVVFPTAAALVAAIPNCQVGSKVFCWIRNDGNNTATFTTNTGLTLSGTATAATTLAQLCVFTATNVTSGAEAGTVHMVLKVAA